MTDKANFEALMQTRRIAARAPQCYNGMIHLKERLRKSGLSQAKFADRIMRTRATVNNWCLARNCPPAVDLPIIAEALGCSIAQLFIPPWEDGVDELDEEAWPQ